MTNKDLQFCNTSSSVLPYLILKFNPLFFEVKGQSAPSYCLSVFEFNHLTKYSAVLPVSVNLPKYLHITKSGYTFNHLGVFLFLGMIINKIVLIPKPLSILLVDLVLYWFPHWFLLWILCLQKVASQVFCINNIYFFFIVNKYETRH